jgi:hypothetical protein
MAVTRAVADHAPPAIGAHRQMASVNGVRPGADTAYR